LPLERNYSRKNARKPRRIVILEGLKRGRHVEGFEAFWEEKSSERKDVERMKANLRRRRIGKIEKGFSCGKEEGISDGKEMISNIEIRRYRKILIFKEKLKLMLVLLWELKVTPGVSVGNSVRIWGLSPLISLSSFMQNLLKILDEPTRKTFCMSFSELFSRTRAEIIRRVQIYHLPWSKKEPALSREEWKAHKSYCVFSK